MRCYKEKVIFKYNKKQYSVKGKLVCDDIEIETDFYMDTKIWILFDKVKTTLNKYGIDKKLHRTTTHYVSPYQLILHNQRYYLMALSERWKNMGYYRLDHITNMSIVEESLTPITSVDGYKNGIDYKKLATALPYMYNDKPETIEMIAEATGFDRENLYFEVVKVKDKLTALKRYIDLYSGSSGIVYCSTRKNVDEIYYELASNEENKM